MDVTNGFRLLERRSIPELQTEGALYCHEETGAELLSLSNNDNNKVFGITFPTPPGDSTGVAHILEHAVLCGSRKYPVKEPFVELLKSSLQTFLNAFTFPDKTCYPVASQNTQDFYNLIDVYLDAVLYPRISPRIFQQEGWHYELNSPDDVLTRKGVVYNEMKGVYSSPESLLALYSQQSLFPDTAYGFDSGGNPNDIPRLTYEQFRAFHRQHYHPSQSRIFFYGNDEPGQRLEFMNRQLEGFGRSPASVSIPLQQAGAAPRTWVKMYPCGNTAGGTEKSFVTVNWLLSETADAAANMEAGVLEHILLGMPGSPLRKALIDAGLGDGLAGVGLERDLRQMYFSTGLKGIVSGNERKVEELILETLHTLSRNGFDPRTVEAALNTVEFRLRENNSGSFPQGLVLMLRALTSWLYGHDPFRLLAFEEPLARLKKKLQDTQDAFALSAAALLCDNLCRTTVMLQPDPDMAGSRERCEREQLQEIRKNMTQEERSRVVQDTDALRALQQTPDSPEALAAIPRLSLDDIDTRCSTIPCILEDTAKPRLFLHDIFTAGIVYVDVGCNLHSLPQRYLPYVPLFARALLEAGTSKHDFVTLSQHIGQKTGGITKSLFTSAVWQQPIGAAWLFLRARAVTERVPEMLDLLSEILTSARLDDKTRVQQILRQEKARMEQKLIPHGHTLVHQRIRAHFNEAHWADEQMNGIHYLLFLRELDRDFETAWASVRDTFTTMRRLLVNRLNMVVNVTLEERQWADCRKYVQVFTETLPCYETADQSWTPPACCACEGLTAQTQVNFVGKGTDLYRLGGYRLHGSVQVITHFLRTTWLWEQVRVMGGAYGASCRFDRMSGSLTFLSYRDPAILTTLKAFDGSSDFLMNADRDLAEIQNSIIGAIGEMDAYMLPDTRGFISLQRWLNGNTDLLRQRLREEVLATTPAEVRTFAEVLAEALQQGIVKVLGSAQSIAAANATGSVSLEPVAIM